jgi:signal transduction histidine kinase
LLCRRKDGKTFTGEILTSVVTLSKESKWLIVVQDITERKQLEQEIIDVANREQQRLGNDLHDGLGQELTGVALMLRSLVNRLGPTSKAIRDDVDEIVRLVNHSIESTRSLAHGLSPVTRDHGGLPAALRSLVSRSRESYKIDIRLRSYIPHDLPIDEATANHLYRIAQEAINNAAKHGLARSIRVGLRANAATLRLSISDNGIGIGGKKTLGTGMGLKIMEYRARMIGGAVKIMANRASGTQIRCICPRTSPGK